MFLGARPHQAGGAHRRDAERGRVAAAEQLDLYRKTFGVDAVARQELDRMAEYACEELLCFYTFPREHWPKLRSTNPLERVNKEIGRRSDVVGIYPNDRALIRLAGMLLLEQNDEWLVQRRYVSEHSMRLILSEPVQAEPSREGEKEVIELTAA